MDALYNLRDMLCEQLECYGEKGEISNAVLEKVDMLAHAVKNLDKVIDGGEYEDEEMDDYSNRKSRRSHSRNAYNSMRRSRVSGRSRRHSRSGDLAEQLYGMMDEVDDEQTRQEIERLASKMDRN